MHRHLPSIRSFAALSLLLVLLAGFCRFAPDAIRSAHTSSDFAAWRKTVSGALPGQVPQHDRLVAVAGLFARLAGWRLFNGVVRLENGMLGRETRRFADPCRLAGRLVRSVREKGIPYLFVLAPCKMDAGGTLMPRGLNSSANEVGGRFLETLADQGVETLDLRTSIAGTPRQVEDCFYRADTHWNLLAAWRVAAQVSVRIAALAGTSAAGVRDAFAEEKWVTCRSDRPWSGYMARRAGSHFGGRDVVFWKEPMRTMDIQRIEADGRRVRGSFSDAVSERAGRAGAGTIGGKNRTVVYENGDAPADLTVLVIKDSFGKPVAAYMSVAFRRVIAVDPRRLSTGKGVGDLIREQRPDVVLEVINAEAILNRIDAPETASVRGYFCLD